LPVEVDVFVSLDAEHMSREVLPGVQRRLSELLEKVGLPTTLTVTRSGATRVVDVLPPIDAHDDADARAWLEGKMREAVVEARRPRTSGPHALVRFPTTAWDAPRPASPLRLI